jgi:hypothetical protein
MHEVSESPLLETLTGSIHAAVAPRRRGAGARPGPGGAGPASAGGDAGGDAGAEGAGGAEGAEGAGCAQSWERWSDQAAAAISVSASPARPPPRTNRTRRVPHPVLTGHAASLTPY